ncbi:MAG TPA: restriction endonuclease, SacI family [Candidatus Thermoplasmatota archaeon]|nr:restriction endonuclease, SacI family [Candidatus Thermoplasmatota archaeon]
MSIRIDKERARTLLRTEAAAVTGGSPIDPEWKALIETLSKECENSSKTHIAFAGTAVLAKATERRADVYAVKSRANTPGAYSARGLCHGVLVPNADELGIDLGRTGREPLNNQPYFQIESVSESELLKKTKRTQGSQPIKALVAILKKLDRASPDDAMMGLRAFISVRRQYRTEYRTLAEPTSTLTAEQFAASVAEFVENDSEGGRRAQAVVAGLLEAVFPPGAVQAKRVNDPDRHFPGDVGIGGAGNHKSDGAGKGSVQRVVEVRDKPVTESDLVLFAQKAARAGIRSAMVVAVAQGQDTASVARAVARARDIGVSLVVTTDWSALTTCALFFGRAPPEATIREALRAIGKRLAEIEASLGALEQWEEILLGEPRTARDKTLD